AGISVGICADELLLDVDYKEDSNCDADINVVMLDNFTIVEVQATAEGKTFDRKIFNELLDLAEVGIKSLFAMQ
ncbi:MAG: ribonuclease PH, partial [Burkholderiales bacterium]|nr:ribonuclease PH [Burkholderiales bacterium]